MKLPLMTSLLVMALLLSVQYSQAAVDHGPWSRLLARYVNAQGHVAYRDLQTHDRAAFDAYLATLAHAQTDGMTEAEEKALWINAYNALIVSGILQGYTAESLLARQRLFRWFTVRIAGKDRTADEIEHQILRKKFQDPRVHFAIVCASSSCPQLRREAYIPERLDAQLDEATQAFLHDPTRNHLEARPVALSRIFEWFAADFINSAGSVAAFVRRFVPEDKQALLNLTDSELRYLEYDWTLNAQAGQRVS
jgi:hypothetical protein